MSALRTNTALIVGGDARHRPDALRMAPRSVLMLAIASVMGLLAFGWPLILDPTSVIGDDPTGQSATPFIMGAILAIVLGVVVSEMTSNDLDVKALAMLGVLSAVIAVLRPLGAGTAGLETIFFLLIVAGRAFGPGFGFVLGCLGLFASALITAGVGTWLPYQMLASGFVAMVAGLLPHRSRGRREIIMLCAYGFVAGISYGYLMDFAFWPFTFGSMSQVGYDPTATPWQNIRTFLVVNTVTSLGWNLGRAFTNVVLVAILGKPLLRVFRRTARRANFA